MTGSFPTPRPRDRLDFTDEVDRAYATWVLPLLGLIFLPLTTLVYALLRGPLGGVEGIEWFWMALAFLLDIGVLGGAARSRGEG